MRDASALLWQAILFLLFALAYTVLSPDLALFPHLRLATLAALLLGASALLAATRLQVIAAFAAALVTACAAVIAAALVFYELVLVVSPARIGMLGLILAYVVGGLFGCAVRACLISSRILWRLRAINPHFPQVGVAPPEPNRQRRFLRKTG